MNPNIIVTIDRFILDGLDLPYHQRPQLQAAVEAELTRLLVAEGLAPGLITGGALARVPAGAIQLTGDNDPTHLGQQIAQAVYGGIGHEASSSRAKPGK
jgi:hypothetical protein